ncbi:MAG: hypothetical protein KJO55_03355 [Gammaproteobacteria bacterium]|nr:hypothetical protein [Gammaproteobacteria bacterium]NND59963.1 hypothetical protein [Gammaproteobacteria bacterium]
MRLYLQLCSLLAVCLWLPFAQAATQGAVGTSSAATVGITLTADLLARIDGLNDILLGAWTGAGNMIGDDDICIGRSGVGFFAAGNYRMRLSGDGDPADVNAFTLSNGVDRIYYDVYFNDQAGLAGRQPVVAGQMLNNQTGLGFFQILNWLFGCVVPNGNVSIVVPESQLQGTTSGNYAGTLTLVLIPD